MNSSKLHITIGLAGLTVMLFGLVFLKTEVIAIPLTGVGGSILATAIVNWVLTRKLDSIPIPSIIEALAQKTEFMRIQHEVELQFSIENSRLRLEKRHKYKLRNPSRFARSRTISMFTDIPSLGNEKTGGFHLIVEPDGTQLTAETLQDLSEEVDGKCMFSKSYNLQPGDGNAFEFRSYNYYRLTDRLIWTVQDLSDGFTVRIINKTTTSEPFKVKINHHRERDIVERMRTPMPST